MCARILFLIGLLLISTACFAQRLIKHAEQEFLPLRDGLRHMYDSLIVAGDSSVYQEGGDYTEFRKWEEFWSLRLKDGDSFTDYERAYARSREAADLKSAESNTSDWHEVGPKDIPFGNVQLGQGSGYGIGPIRFLTLNSQYPDTMLCGSHSGGLFYTEDEGLNWRMAGSDTWARSGCQYAVFNAADPCIWYAANSGYWGYAGGIHRTLDCGETWQLIADQDDFYSGGVWTAINQLIPDHTDTNVLYATSEHQLWRTNNANDPDPVWEIVEIPLPPSIDNHPTYGSYWFPDARNVYDMVLDPVHNDTMYLAVHYEGSLTDTVLHRVRYWRLLRSFDRGLNWTELENQPEHPFTMGIADAPVEGDRWDRNAEHLTIEGTIADHDRLYLLYDVPGYQVGEVWRSTAVSTGAWDSNPLINTIEVIYGGGHGFGVSQTNGEDLFLDHNNISPSIGRYVTYVDGQWTNYYGNSNYLQYHVDVEDFVGHPTEPGELWLADHGGIHKSTDSGQSWEWRGRGLAVAEPWRITDSYADDDHILMGLFHEATVLSQPEYSPEWVPEWRQLTGGDGQKPIIDPDEPNRMFWSSQGNRWYKSSNYGQTSTQLTGMGSGDWNTEGAMDRGDPNALYIPGWFFHPTDSVYHCEIRRSFDHWTTRDTISNFYPSLGPGKWIWRLYPAWPDPNYLYAYFSDTPPRLFRSQVARAEASLVRDSWHEIEGALPRTDAWVSDVDFDFVDPNILYIAYSSASMHVDTSVGTGMLYRVDCTDTSNVVITDLTGSDTTWSALPNTGIESEAVTLERGSDGGIYVATDVGVFYLNNKLMTNGLGWQLLGTNLPHAQCRGLLINYKANRLRAGMYGRGLWEHGLWCPDSTDLVEAGTYAADAFQEATNSITSTALIEPDRTITYRGGHSVRMTAGFHAGAGSVFHAYIHPCDVGGNSFKSSQQQASSSNQTAEWAHRAIVPRGSSQLFPNPSSGKFRITKPKPGLKASVQAFDQTGREVLVRAIDQRDWLDCEVNNAESPIVLTLRASYSDGSVEHHRATVVR